MGKKMTEKNPKTNKCACTALKEEIAQLEKSLQESLLSAESFKNQWQRERADFLNYKKEDSERIKQMRQYALESLIERLLPALDSFGFAKSHLKESQLADPGVQGLLMTGKMITDAFKGMGIEPISYLGKQYDPIECEVIEEMENTDCEPGTVITETQIGYKTKERLLRPCKVKIAKTN
jgi:molecular chaperone GrpE